MKNLVQRTGATFDATVNGALVLANPLIKAKRTKCMLFDGATNWLSVPSGLNWQGDFSAAFWIKTLAAGAFISIFTDTTGFTTGQVTTAPGHETCYRWFFNSGVLFQDTPEKHPIGNTYFVAMTRSGTVLKIFVNGRFASVGVAGAPPAAGVMYIGKWTGASGYMNGYLDNMLLYSVALTPDQIVSIYRSANPRA